MALSIHKHSTIFFAFIWLMLFSSSGINAQSEFTTARIWNVEIEGNERFEDLIIERYIANQRPSFWQRISGNENVGMDIDEFEIRKDVVRIERFYQRRGYPNVEVSYKLLDGSSPDRKNLVFSVIENEALRILNVEYDLNVSADDVAYIINNREYKRALNRSPFRPNRRYQIIEEAEVIGTFSRVLKNIGYIYADVEVEATIDSLNNQANVLITLNAGPRTRISTFNIEGEETIDDRYILRETGLKIGELYSEEKLRAAQREVFKHHLFRLALISVPDQPQDSTLDLTLQVTELPLRSFRVQGGIGDFDRLNDPLAIDNFWKLFRTQSRWIYRNIDGKGTQFSSTVKLSHFEKYLSTEFLFPYVFNTQSSFTVSPFIENRLEPAYSITTGGLINSIGYEYNRNLTGTFAYEFAINNEYDIANERTQDVTEILPDSVLNYNISSFSFNLYYANGLSRGRRGWIVQPYVEFSGLFGESSFSFQKLSFDVRKYSELSSKLVLATRLQSGAIYFAKQDSLPADIEFYAGGTSSVRGYTRNELGPKRAIIVESDNPQVPDQVNFVPIGGKAFLTFNVELRQRFDRVLKGFGMAAFLDGGQVWRSTKSINERALQYSTGAGIRYETPIGPIRVDIGYLLNPSDFDLELLPGINDSAARRWRFHFSIGQAF